MSTTTTTTRKTASIMNLASLVTSNGPDSSPIPRLQTTTNAAALTPKPLSRTYDQYCERETPTSPDYSTSFGMNATPASTSVASISPQTPLSPPAEEQRKWSLPSISSLLDGAAADAALPSAKRLRLSSEPRAPLQSTDLNVMKGSRIVLPPTPPLRPGSGFSESKRSPAALSPPDSAISPTSISPSSNPIKNPESFQQQQQQRSRSQSQSQTPTLASLVSAASAIPTERASASQDSHMQSRFNGPTYPSPAPTISSYTSPVEPSPSPVIYYQRATPASSFQASRNVPASAAPSASSSQLISPVNPAWQHHHYFPPSASPPYPQNHDRYVCRTCHKAFSRPSSLRIHSHSHTGEKPFRCTHVGCGKAFSVRSNMKRHERGCHTGRPVAATLV